ncbi:hypothetical protein [Pedobacter psychroterrae]|uniref:Uncharacterized protein n=1 Tax=Pedobacter psychroterrae TaxID=2530453 RepID=A0A4R0NCH6_9SPHI|nr:hypothetical protein [Pedobacter psychroterrae]TCC98039.1 hypothetical protein EZ437_19535 [Pedobacter psychroterrae]
MSDKVIHVFTNRNNTPYRLIELSNLTKLTSGFKYAIDRFDGKEFVKIKTCYFKDIQSADKQFRLRENVDNIIKRREKYYQKEDHEFYRSLKGTKFETLYKVLRGLTITDFDSDFETVSYEVDLNSVFRIPELSSLGISATSIREVVISQSDAHDYLGFKFRDGSGRGIIDTIDYPNMERHRTQFDFHLSFATHLCS